MQRRLAYLSLAPLLLALSLDLSCKGIADNGRQETVPIFPSEGPLFPDYDCLKTEGTSINWRAWLDVFVHGSPHTWSTKSSPYLIAFMDAEPEEFYRFQKQCPMGVITAEIMLYVSAIAQGDHEVSAGWGDAAREMLSRFPLRILVGTQWPNFVLLTGENTRIPEIAEDRQRNCLDVENPAIDWPSFLKVFDDEDKEEWFVQSIRYVWSWQMRQLTNLLYKECPLGVLTAHVIAAFTCAATESTCFADQAKPIEDWIQSDPDALASIAHSRWPLGVLINHISRGTRHRFALDFNEEELASLPGGAEPKNLTSWGQWSASLQEQGASQAYRDLIGLLPHLGNGLLGAPTLVYVTMIYGRSFNRHLRRFCGRARALGLGKRLVLFTLDDEAYSLCMKENGHRCMRGTPSILNKFTMPLVFARLGLDTMWIDLDVFLMKDPTPYLVEHASHGDYEILISGSFESDCICNGLVYFKATQVVCDWLLGVLVWMYDHPYEHDQKTFSAFLDYTEQVSNLPLDLPPLPRWSTLEAVNQFVTPDTYEGNGWSGNLEDIVIYHFLNGESDTGSGLDQSGSWMREYGHFEDDWAPPQERTRYDGQNAPTTTKVTLMDLFYMQPDDDLYFTDKAPYESPAIRSALLAARKETRRTDLFGRPCGPMTDMHDGAGDRTGSAEELLAQAKQETG
mmetsp:Transcript_30515/g.65717  ORF Transcript_30515/g.65717 Transcript_30515/m.65717 type:complete len:680 (+) Transcript_30515:127-2166(+)